MQERRTVAKLTKFQKGLTKSSSSEIKWKCFKRLIINNILLNFHFRIKWADYKSEIKIANSKM